MLDNSPQPDSEPDAEPQIHVGESPAQVGPPLPKIIVPGRDKIDEDVLTLVNPAPDVVDVSTENDYIILHLADGTTQPVYRREALERALAMQQMLKQDNGMVPRHVLQKRAWLIVEIVKACQKAAKHYGTGYSQAKVDEFLKKTDREAKLASQRNT
jgi:hypothetical protein